MVLKVREEYYVQTKTGNRNIEANTSEVTAERNISHSSHFIAAEISFSHF